MREWLRTRRASSWELESCPGRSNRHADGDVAAEEAAPAMHCSSPAPKACGKRATRGESRLRAAAGRPLEQLRRSREQQTYPRRSRHRVATARFWYSCCSLECCSLLGGIAAASRESEEVPNRERAAVSEQSWPAAAVAGCATAALAGGTRCSHWRALVQAQRASFYTAAAAGDCR